MRLLFLGFCLMFSFVSYGFELKASYNTLGMNMTLLSAQMNLKMDENGYEIKTTSKARGMLSMFIHSQSVFETTGVFKDDKEIVKTSVMTNTSHKKAQTTYKDIDETYLDYQSVLVHLMRLKEPQTQNLLVADGKREMRITLTYEGEKNLALINKKLTGQASAYSVRITILSGKKKGWFFKRIQEENVSPLWVYFQKDETTQMPILIASTFDTGVVGKLYIVNTQKTILK